MNKISINGLLKEDLNLKVYDIVQELIEDFKIKGDTRIFIKDERKSYQSNLFGKRDIMPDILRWQFTYTNEIIIERGVIKKINFDEYPEILKTLIAHECSHISHNDPLFFAISSLFGLIVVVLISVLVENFFFHNLLLSLIVAVLTFIIVWRLKNHWRVKVETRCDKEAVLITKNPEALEEGLKKIHIEFDDAIKIAKFQEKFPMYFRKLKYWILGDTHPKLFERIKNIENLLDKC